jgi:geranylgeranyl diphosphate synthase type 3
VDLLGRYYQIRDDYQNLKSSEVYFVEDPKILAVVMTLMQCGQAKGFCEDLDEGKFSFPLMHFVNTRRHTHVLHELLRQRMDTGAMSGASKALVLEMLENSGSLEYTRQVLRMLYEQIKDCIGRVEKVTGGYNQPMRLLLHALYI